MKFIVTGATGLVGAAVLKHCIARSEISSIVVITRKPIPAELANHAKVTAIVHEDYLTYPEDLIDKCRGAEVCLWAQGLRGAPLGYSDLSYAKKVDIEYPITAAEAFSKHLLPQSPSQRFRFVLCSGVGAEWDQDKSFWFMGQTRRLKGLAETKLREFTTNDERFETFTIRPFGIIEENGGLLMLVLKSVMPSAPVGDIAAVMVDLGMNGSEKWVWEHDEIREKGRELTSGTSG